MDNASPQSVALFQQAEQVYYSALSVEPSARAAYLAQACADNEALRHEVESLLAAHEEAGSFIAGNAVADQAHRSFELADQPTAMLPRSTSREINQYRVISLLGQGGMGEVWLAEDTRLHRKVALKLLPAQFATDAARVRRFEQEAHAISALNHPNIITLFDLGHAGDDYFMATEFVDGQTLRDRLNSDASLPVVEAADIAIQVCQALVAAHEAGVIHRDIKPENLMLRRDGYVKVLDFGLAHVNENLAAPAQSSLTDSGMVMGTASYMSPEQARGEKVDARADIFSLGIVLYEMIEGRPPFPGASVFEVIGAILNREPEPMTKAPAEWQAVVQKALRKERAARYSNIGEMLTDLKSLKQSAGLLDKPQANGDEKEATPTLILNAPPTNGLEVRRTTSSLENVVVRMKAHPRFVFVSLLALFLAVAGGLFYVKRQPPLTDKDVVLLVDFENKTNDPIFDGTLKQGLAVQLEQSPFLSLYPETEVRQALKLMERSPDERLTAAIGREVCERQGLKALIAGTVAALGSHYVITLEALDGRSGVTLAREQFEAESKELILKTLATASRQLREKLGESLASIQKFDAPWEQAKTSSLEALKAYYLGNEQRLRGRYGAALPFFKRAVEIAPDFALAHTVLAEQYSLTRQPALAVESAIKAYALRERASEREKFLITYYYFFLVTQEWEKGAELLNLWKQTYPRDVMPLTNLAFNYNYSGQFEKAEEEARAALRLIPNVAAGYGNLGRALLGLNRYAEAKEVFKHMIANQYEASGTQSRMFGVAFVLNDTALMKQTIEWAQKTTYNQIQAFLWQANTAAYAGQFRQAQESFQRAVNFALQNNMKEDAALIGTDAALFDAQEGNCRQAKTRVASALALSTNSFPQIRTISAFENTTLALALCGDERAVKGNNEELSKRHPQATRMNHLWLPVIRAALALQQGKAQSALELLQTTVRYEAAADFWPQSLRAQALMKLGKGADAAAEFQKILDHRGYAPLSCLYPLARLGLGRAMTLQGEREKAKQAYEEFFRMWKDADANLPVLVDAKREYEKMK